MRDTGAVTEKEKDYASNINLLSTTDPKGVITFVNEGFAKVAGFKKEELNKQAHNIVRHKSMPQIAFKMLWDTIQSGQSWMGIVKNRCKNGDHYWVNAFVTPIKDNQTGATKEYQSVRVKPQPIWVKRAAKLYEQLQKGKIPHFIKRKPLGLLQKLSLTLWSAVGTGMGINAITAKASFIEYTPSLIVCGVIAQIALWYYLKPLKKLVNETQTISQDPVAMHVYTGRNDEIGQIMLAIQVLKTEAGALVGRIKEDSGELLNETEAFMDKVDTSKEKVEEIQNQTHKVFCAMEKMSHAIDEVADSASDAAQAAYDAQKESDKGSELVTKTANDIENLAHHIDQSANVIEQLEKNSEDIASILDVIVSIAEQTNLLALNAAIEAARAGDQGRGFAVVADEVRTLANRTHESTKEISEMIKKLSEGSQAAVSSMQAARKQTEESVTQAQQASQAIEKVTSSLDTITDMSQHIASAVEQQSTTSNGIEQNVNELSQSSEKLSALSEDNSHIGTHLTNLAADLHGIAEHFFDTRNQQVPSH